MIFDDKRHLSHRGLKIGTLRKIVDLLGLFAIDQRSDGLVGDDTVRVRKEQEGLRWFIHVENLDQKVAGGLEETRSSASRFPWSTHIFRDRSVVRRSHPNQNELFLFEVRHSS